MLNIIWINFHNTINTKIGFVWDALYRILLNKFTKNFLVWASIFVGEKFMIEYLFRGQFNTFTINNFITSAAPKGLQFYLFTIVLINFTLTLL